MVQSSPSRFAQKILMDIKPKVVQQFIQSGPVKPSKSLICCRYWALKKYISYLKMRGEIQTDFSNILIAPRIYRRQHYPRLLTRKEIHAMLSAIDRRTSIGKRDIVVSESLIMKWMTRIARESITVQSSINKISSVDAFLEMLTSDLTIPVNPIRCIRERFAERGWVGIVLAFRSPSPDCLLLTHALLSESG